MSGTADYISKKKLLGMVNDYVDMLNGTPVRSHELKSAMQSSPELELGNEGRIQNDDGTEERAYSGIVLTLPSFHDPQGSHDLYKFSKRHLNKFDDTESISSAQMLVILETELELEACRYLESCNEDTSSMLEVIKALDLSENQIGKILDCEYVSVDSSSGSVGRFPNLVFDREAFNDAVKDSDELVGEVGQLKRPQKWLRDKFSSWSRDTQREVEDILDEAVAEGFGRDAMEDAIDSYLDEGELFEPQPGVVKLMN